MAMNIAALGADLAQVVINSSTVPPSPDAALNLQDFWTNIAAAIVEHIQENAEVPAGIAVSTPAGQGATSAAGKVE
ncbi:MAG: hypothetical protein LBH57_03265 [Treponema sp.]|jgi:hypothetical protein|nr:hypothetical protein [Treponema sp.]